MSAPTVASFGTVDSFTPEQLWMPGKQRVFARIMIAAGQDLPAGAVVGQVTATGLWKLSASAAGDGSEVPAGIIPAPIKAVDETGANADKPFQVVVEGYVNPNALTFGAGHTWATVEKALRQQGIYGTFPLFSGS